MVSGYLVQKLYVLGTISLQMHKAFAISVFIILHIFNKHMVFNPYYKISH